MTSNRSAGGVSQAALDALRHDLLNPLNVVAGAAAGLLESDLSDAQRAWVHMIQSATARLHDVIRGAERYDTSALTEGRARLADLCSIAAARVGKPFDRQRLVEAIEAVAGRRPLRVLLVDDAPDLALLVRTYLAPTGWTLDTVETGERAVVQASSAQYDVVLMDIDLPGLDGATAAHAIRAADLARGVSPTPIIAMTAFDPGQTPPAPAERATAGEVVTIDDPGIVPLVPEFLELRRADVYVFRDALAAGAYATIQSTAHKMKGTGRGYGFDTLSRLGGELEVAAHEQDLDAMRRLIDELDDYLSHVEVVSAQHITGPLSQ
jgi:CheY-like chemotaxis protein